jgi:4-amino-4-deoxy-L-arabinose transferase-like glycosyltransferase
LSEHAGARLRVAGALAAPLALWAVLFVAIPSQDFPLNDDWAYARGAIAFARGEGVHYYHWAGIPLLGQWLWSQPWLALLGESNTVLRGSTVLLSELAVLAFFDLLRREGLAPSRAAFAAAALGVCPLFFLLSGTYMSDVPSISFSLIALACYARAFERGGAGMLVAATAAAALGVMTRQNALAAPAAAGLILLARPTLRRRAACLLAVAAPIAAGVATAIWFRSHGDGLARGPVWPELGATASRAFAAGHFVGLAVLPLLALDPAVASARIFVAGGVAMAAAAWGLAGDALFPYLGNMLTPWGVLTSGDLFAGRRPLVLGHATRLALTVLGCGGAAWLLARRAHRGAPAARPRLLAAFTGLQISLLAVSPVLFDRYLLWLLPGAILAAARPSGARPHRAAGALVLLVFAAASLGLTHDWLSWNAARWALGRRALDRGIAATEIEGGVEWDGWFSVAGARKNTAPHGLVLPFNARFFADVDVPYALAFSQPAGTIRLDAEPYRLWLPPGQGEFLLVEADPESGGNGEDR